MLHQQNRGAALAVDAHHDLENLFGELRRQAQTGLIQQDQVGVGHQGARDRQHLLLSAGEQAGVLGSALTQDGEVVVHTFDVLGDTLTVLAGVGAHQQVVAHAQQREHFASLGYMTQALLHNKCGVLGGDVAALEFDRPLARINDAGDGLQDGRLAGPIGAEHGGNLAAPHLQTYAANRLDRSVSAFDVEQLEHRRVTHGGRTVAHAACLRSDDTSSTEPR